MTYVIKWAWRYSSLEATEFDSLDAAISAAAYAADYGEEAFDCIEVWDEHGHRVIGRDEGLRLAHDYTEAVEAATPKPPPNVAVVRLKNPTGKWSTYSGYPTQDAAETDAARFREHLGDDRVKVEPVRRR